MTRLYFVPPVCIVGFLVVANLASLDAQGARRGGGGGAPAVAFDARNPDPTAGPVVAGAPFSGEAATTVTQTLGDGTRIEQRVTAKLYRDGTGRVRREQTIMGLDRLSPAPPQTVITFDSVPGDPMPYVLDPAGRVASRTNRGVRWYSPDNSFGFAVLQRSDAGLGLNDASGRALERYATVVGRSVSRLGGVEVAPIPPDVRPSEDQLGTRLMEGVKATGRRTTTVIPAGRLGNDRAIQITDERWESPELNLTVYSRFSDPRTGVVEYRLMNINRAEPRADLFTLPPDYTEVGTPGLRTGGPAAQPAQPGGRGQRGGRAN